VSSERRESIIEGIGAGCALIFFVLGACILLGMAILVWRAVL